MLVSGAFDYGAIGRSLEASVTEVYRLVAAVAQPSSYSHVDACIDEEAHDVSV